MFVCRICLEQVLTCIGKWEVKLRAAAETLQACSTVEAESDDEDSPSTEILKEAQGINGKLAAVHKNISSINTDGIVRGFTKQLRGCIYIIYNIYIIYLFMYL